MRTMYIQNSLSLLIEEFRERGKWGTAHIYQTTYNVFTAFCQGKNLRFEQLTPSILKHFEEYLRQRGCTWNTVSTYMKTLRAVYNQAIDSGIAIYTPRLFRHVYTGTLADKRRTMEMNDIGLLLRQIEEEQYSSNALTPKDRSKILFILMFLLRGIPFVDLVYLRKKDLKGNMLSYRRKKTGRPLHVHLSDEALRLIELMRNPDMQSPYLFPVIRAAEGTEKAYREYQSALRKFNNHLAVIKQELGIETNFSSYSARHTWATAAYRCEIHPGVISEAMGHSSIRVTETYLKPFEDHRIDEANRQVMEFVKRQAK